MPSLALALLLRAALPVSEPAVPGDPEFIGMIKARRREMHAATVKLAGKVITSDQWYELMRGVLLEGHTRAAYLGRLVSLQESGAAELADVLAGQAVCDAEEFYLRGFLADLLAKDPRFWDAELETWIEESIKRRQDAYLGRMRGTANEAFLRHSPVDAKFAWKLGATEDHCSECPEYATWGALPETEWPTTPGGNDTPCMFNCKCHFERDDGVTGFAPVEL